MEYKPIPHAKRDQVYTLKTTPQKTNKVKVIKNYIKDKDDE